MNRIARITACALPLVLLLPLAATAQMQSQSQTPAQMQSNPATVNELTAMLRQFMSDASTNNAAGFDKFFADDVIYTRSAGATTTKAEIMKSVTSEKPPTDTKVTFTAEDISVHDYGDTAVVAFRLVGRTEHKDGKVEEAYYRNTGTFLRRNGKWQVIAWQATKIPENPVAQSTPK